MSFATYFNNPKSYWLRWLLVLPLSIVAYIITSPIVKSLYDLSTFFAGDYWGLGEYIKRYFVASTAGLFSGCVFVAVGSTVAPASKKIAVIILIILQAVLICISFLYSSPNSEYNAIAENIFVLIGMGVQYMSEKEKGFYTLQNI